MSVQRVGIHVYLCWTTCFLHDINKNFSTSRTDVSYIVLIHKNEGDSPNNTPNSKKVLF